MARNFVYLHTPGCGKAAFYLDRMPEGGEVVRSADAELPDGSKPKTESLMVCGTCGDPIWAPFGRPSRANIEAVV